MSEFKTEGIDIHEYLNILKKHKWLVLACLLASLFITVLINETQTPIYTASSRIEIKSTPQAFLPEYSYWSDWFTKEREMNTHFETLKSYDILVRVCKKVRIKELVDKYRLPESRIKQFIDGLFDILPGSSSDTRPVQAPGPAPSAEQPALDSMALSLTGAVSVQSVKDTNLADLVVTHSNPLVATQVANALADVYEDYLLENRFSEVRNIMNIYTDQLITLKKSMRESEEKYLTFVHNHGISSLQDKKEITLEGLSDLKLGYTDTRVRRAELESELNSLDSILRFDVEKVLQAPLLDKNPILNQIKQEILTNQLQLGELLKKYRPQHPEVVRKEAMLQTLQQKFKDEINTVLRNKKSELDVLQAKEKELSRAIQENESIAISDTSVALEYRKLKDEMESNKTLYETLLGKIKELDITKGSQASSINIIDRASMPGAPIRPQKSRNLSLGFLVGLLLGVGIAFGLEYIDRTFKNIDQIKNVLQLPTIAMISHLSPKEMGRNIIIPTHKSDSISAFHEAFRFLKTNLVIATLNRKHSTVMITSTGPSEGKTTVATHLAMALAPEGRDILLIDLDLRRPRLHRVFNIPNDRGFTSLIVDPFAFIPLAGELQEISISDLIYLLIHMEKSGVLTIDSENGKYKIYLLNGKIAQIDSTVREENDRLGNLLINKLGFSKYALQKAIRESGRRKQKLGEYLFDTGAISADKLVEVLQHQFITSLNQLIQVTAGSYHFSESENLYFHLEILQKLQTEKHLLENLDIQSTPIQSTYDRFCIYKTDTPNLYVLPAGPRAPDPDEVLSSNRISMILNLLRHHFHTVVIDSPPSALVSDSNTLCPYVDGIVYVVKYGEFTRKLIHNTVERIRSNNAKILGVVFNSVDLKRESYYDYHYYYYSHYYGKDGKGEEGAKPS